jgi:DNA (cytosine-5)-methyltransferase 1
MIYGSVCSGIEAATVAWEPLGWKPAWFSEIEPFPNSVLEQHYPKIPNLGDMTKIHETKTFQENKIDLLVGGTPCQSFSQAGLRRAFDDPRGDLALKFIRIISLAKPEWFLWENVTGVLSSDGGKSFQEFIYQIQKLGYGFAYRVFDAQYFGVPQKRRRVYLVGHRGDWRTAAQILFESKSLQGDIASNENTQQNRPATRGRAQEGNRVMGADVYNYAITGDIAATFGANSGGTNTHGPKFIDENGIRKLTPVECERLMGFPDNYTRVPHKGKVSSECLDSWRYHALGNSMVIPAMRWIGERIKLVGESMQAL